MKKQKWHGGFMVGVLAAFCLAGCGSWGHNNEVSTENGTITGSENQGEIRQDWTAADRDTYEKTGHSSENTQFPENENGGGNKMSSKDENYGITSYAPVQDFSYQLLSQNLEHTNPVLSPSSAYLAIGLAGLGAEGETRTEFGKVLGISDIVNSDIADKKEIENFPEILGQLTYSLMNRLPQEKEGIQVTIANSAWVDEELTANRKWLDDAAYFFDAEVTQTKLSTEETQKKINTWVKQKTSGLIKDFLSEPLPDDTRLALFDTVYFHGDWELPFDGYMTREQEFTTNSDEKLKVDMMQMYRTKQQYLKSDTAEGVVLPYQGGNYSFVALKPADGSSVREMYAQLTMEEINQMIDEKQDIEVNLRLPKFEITFDKVLNDSLANMGLNLAFDPDNADFSGIGATLSGNNLYISLVRQKAVIKVDEEGTEAAAATEVVAADGAAMLMEQPVDVFFDQPFLYLIMENDTKIPLFIGILDTPQTE